MDTAECYVAGWMGGRFGGEWTHVYVWLRPFGCPPETVTTLLIGHTIQNKKKSLSQEKIIKYIIWNKVF